MKYEKLVASNVLSEESEESVCVPELHGQDLSKARSVKAKAVICCGLRVNVDMLVSHLLSCGMLSTSTSTSTSTSASASTYVTISDECTEYSVWYM